MLKKRLRLGYLPGGGDKYIDTLTKCLEYLQTTNPSEKQLIQWLLQTFKVKTSVVKSSISTMKNLELIVKSDDKILLSDTAVKFLQTHDNNLIYERLNANYFGIGEILQLLHEKSRTIDEIFGILNQKIGGRWGAKRQVEIRINWLFGLGYITKVGQKCDLAKENKHVGAGAEEEPKCPTHTEILDMLVTIGKAKHLTTKREYPLNHERLDVLWRRGGQSVAWEVHLEANIHQALSKLKQAFEDIPAEPCLVTTEEGESKARDLLKTSFPRLKKFLKIIHWKEILELYNAAMKDSYIMENKLGFNQEVHLRGMRRKKLVGK